MEVQHGLDADGFRAHARNSQIAELALGQEADALNYSETQSQTEAQSRAIAQTSSRTK